MDLLALLGLTMLVRRLRRRPAVPSVITTAPFSLPTSAGAPTRSAYQALLIRAARGLLLAALLALLILLPWPTTWVTSAQLAAALRPARIWAIANLDLLTIVLITVALAEPALLRLLAALGAAPHLLWLLGALGGVQLQVGYWRWRNWRQQHRSRIRRAPQRRAGQLTPGRLHRRRAHG